MIYRAISCWLCILLLSQPFLGAAHAMEAGTVPVSSSRSSASPYAWIARFFMRELRSWLIGKGFDYLASRLDLARNGRQTVNHLSVILRDVPLTSNERAQIVGVQNELQRVVAILEQNSRSDEQVRREILSLRADIQRSLDQVERTLEYLDQRLTQIELQQREQYKMIVDLTGLVVELDRQVVDHEGQLVSLEQRVREVESRTTRLEETVNPDPNRFLRHDWVFSLSALYANSPVLGNDARIGGQLAAQYNINKTFGIFADLFWAPVSASDAEGFDAGSRVFWESFGGVLGLTMNVLPPQSFLSFQLSGGGGLVHSSLSEYPEGVSISDPEGGYELGSVSNAALIGKAEIGISPPAAGIEPFAAFGYLQFVDDLAFESTETTTNAGRDLWYVTVGVRVRVFDRGGRK